MISSEYRSSCSLGVDPINTNVVSIFTEHVLGILITNIRVNTGLVIIAILLGYPHEYALWIYSIGKRRGYRIFTPRVAIACNRNIHRWPSVYESTNLVKRF